MSGNIADYLSKQIFIERNIVRFITFDYFPNSFPLRSHIVPSAESLGYMLTQPRRVFFLLLLMK